MWKTIAMMMAAGCATGYREALNDEGIGRGRWFISAEGNHWTDRAMLNRYTRVRAAQRCPTGFDILDVEHTPLVDRLIDHVDGDGVILIVRCKSSPSAGLEDDDTLRVHRGWWCTERGDVGACAATAVRCNHARGRANQGKESNQTFAPCEHRERAVCGDSGCFTTPETCVHYEQRDGRTGAGCVGRDE